MVINAKDNVGDCVSETATCTISQSSIFSTSTSQTAFDVASSVLNLPSEEKISNRGKSHSRKKPEGHIPRPKNAFILFRSEFITKHKSELVNSPSLLHTSPTDTSYDSLPSVHSKKKTKAKKIKIGETDSTSANQQSLSRIAGTVWKALPDSERARWFDLARVEKATHAQRFPNYQFAPVPAYAPYSDSSLSYPSSSNDRNENGHCKTDAIGPIRRKRVVRKGREEDVLKAEVEACRTVAEAMVKKITRAHERAGSDTELTMRDERSESPELGNGVKVISASPSPASLAMGQQENYEAGDTDDRPMEEKSSNAAALISDPAVPLRLNSPSERHALTSLSSISLTSNLEVSVTISSSSPEKTLTSGPSFKANGFAAFPTPNPTSSVSSQVSSRPLSFSSYASNHPYGFISTKPVEPLFKPPLSDAAAVRGSMKVTPSGLVTGRMTANDIRPIQGDERWSIRPECSKSAKIMPPRKHLLNFDDDDD